MSDATTAPTGTATPPAAPPSPPATPPAAPAPDATAQQDPNWLAPRLDQAKRSAKAELLAELGVDDPAKAKAALAAAKATEEANKSAEQRAAELAAKLGTAQSETERLRAIATEHSARMMAVLTPEQQAAVQAIAGDDPASRLRTIGALAPTWAKKEADATAAAAVAAAAATTPPATTAPIGAAPPAASPQSPPDHRSVYSQTRATNPFEAAAYGLEHPEVYEPKR